MKSAQDSSQNPYSYDGAAAPVRSGKLPEFEYWDPPSEVVQHDGRPIPATMLFPFKPPKALGRIYTASSEWSSGYRSRLAHPGCLIPILIISALMVWAVFGIVKTARADWPVAIFQTIPLIGFSALFIFVIQSVRAYECEFVGEEGYCIFRVVRGKRTADLFLFQDCDFLRYGFGWDTGQICCSFVMKDGEDRGYWGYLGEYAWTKRLLREYRRTLEQGKPADFYLDKQSFFRVTNDAVVFHHAKSAVRLTAMDFNRRVSQRRRLVSRSFKGELIPMNWQLPIQLNPAVENSDTAIINLPNVPNMRAFLILVEHTLGQHLELGDYELQPAWHPGKWV